MFGLLKRIKNTFEDSMERYFLLVDLEVENELDELMELHVFEKSKFETI